jgi:exopolysaccharide biosynthesis polyprenyl glycosylphosphotransferase
VAIRFGFNSDVQARGPLSISYETFGAVIIVFWWAALALFHTRDPNILGDGGGVMEYRRVVRATLIMFGTVAILSVLLKWDMSRGFLAITLPLGLVSLLISRKAWRVWLRSQRRRGNCVSRALVVGSPKAAERLANSFNSDARIGMVVAGAWVPDAQAGSTGELETVNGPIPSVGDDYDVLSAIALVDADTVVVTDSEHLGPEGMRELTWQLEGANIDLMVSPNLVDVSAPRMHLGPVGGEPFIHLEQPQYAEAGNALKGFFDASLGTILLIAVLPILVLAAVAIKVSSPGPVFFTQTRIGRRGVPFKIIKLRTMKIGSDRLLQDLLRAQGRGEEPLYKVEDDPRITKVGRFLRRYSIDELPQLFNVIKGDMSLVGPRPQRDSEVDLYDHKAARRLTVRPGMTGLWQISGRSDLAWEQAIRLDLYYVENWSMTGDLLILWKTVRAVIARVGAY